MIPRNRSVVSMLQGGDRRSIGRSEQVAERVLKEPDLFGALMDAMEGDDPVVRMRAADAAEKVSVRRPDLLGPHEERLLTSLGRVPQQEVRWHVAQMIPRLALGERDRSSAITLLFGYPGDDSRIVQVCALQALWDLSQDDPRLRKRVVPQLEALEREGSPAVRARARKLLRNVRYSS